MKKKYSQSLSLFQVELNTCWEKKKNRRVIHETCEKKTKKCSRTKKSQMNAKKEKRRKWKTKH